MLRINEVIKQSNRLIEKPIPKMVLIIMDNITTKVPKFSQDNKEMKTILLPRHQYTKIEIVIKGNS